MPGTVPFYFLPYPDAETRTAPGVLVLTVLVFPAPPPIRAPKLGPRLAIWAPVVLVFPAPPPIQTPKLGPHLAFWALVVLVFPAPPPIQTPKLGPHPAIWALVVLVFPAPPPIRAPKLGPHLAFQALAVLVFGYRPNRPPAQPAVLIFFGGSEKLSFLRCPGLNLIPPAGVFGRYFSLTLPQNSDLD